MRLRSGDPTAYVGGGLLPSVIARAPEPAASARKRRGFGSPAREITKSPFALGLGSRPAKVIAGRAFLPSESITDALTESPARTAVKTRLPTQLGRSSRSGVWVSCR